MNRLKVLAIERYNFITHRKDQNNLIEQSAICLFERILSMRSHDFFDFLSDFCKSLGWSCPSNQIGMA